MAPILFADAAQIVTPVSPSDPQRGTSLGEITVYRNASLSADPRSGRITAIGPWKKIKARGARVVEAKGQVIVPGFVDSHTHPLYAGRRVDEFMARAQGKGYLEILAEGGGILSTVQATRRAGSRDLEARAARIFERMLLHGTTTVEAKTGYGLSTREEVRHLKILQKLKKKSRLEIFVTFMGAHAIPPEYRDPSAVYVDLVCREMIPRIARAGLADFCDVFCEEGIFSVEESRRILQTARDCGLKLRLHADEFKPSGGAELGASLEALSADHLMGISENGIRALAQSRTAAVLLPCTSFFLGKEAYAPAREMIDAGAIVALATDFNAGSNLCYSMPMTVSLGILRMKMSPAEALVAATLHGAYALGASARLGSLHPGKQADFLLLEGEDYREVFYRYGANPVSVTVKRGKIVNERL